jgi:heavy metal sensor kinase
MRAVPIRKQLTAWYFLIVAAALIGFAIFALAIMRQSIYTTVDEQLEDRARALQSLIANSDAAGVADELKKRGELQSGTQLFQVSDSSGHFIYRSRVMQQVGVPAGQATQSRTVNAEYEGLPLRMMTTTAVAGNLTLVVQVAEPMDDFLEAVERFRTAMLLGIPVLLFAAAAGGHWMSTRAMRPVGEITGAAQAITPQDLSQRVAVPQTGDELQHLAETLNNMLQRIETAVERITQFTADASHELRTPIALIRTRAEVTLDNPRTNDQYRHALQEVLAESERTSALIENLMLLARSDTGTEALNFQRTDLNALARDVCTQAQTLAEAKQLTWKAVLPEAPTRVQGDPGSLRRLLLILIDNAAKYTPRGGTVSLTIRSAGNHAEIVVQDSGIGIPEADLPHIFERFYRADKARSRESGGTGLGLSIGHWIAQAHGGEIRVESSVGVGSSFMVSLPVQS